MMRIRINESLTYSKKVRKRMKKQPVIKDERTEKLDGKVAGELVLGMFLFLAISVFFKGERGKMARAIWRWSRLCSHRYGH